MFLCYIIVRGKKKRDAPPLLVGETLHPAALLGNENTLNTTSQTSIGAAAQLCFSARFHAEDLKVPLSHRLCPLATSLLCSPPLSVHQGRPKYSLGETPHRSATHTDAWRQTLVLPAKAPAEIWRQLFFAACVSRHPR